MKLYNYWRSSSSYRVRIGLALKGIDYEYVPVNIHPRAAEQTAERFVEVNPLRQVPVLEIDDAPGVRRISQSMAILEYLEERFPTPALLPGDFLQRALVRQLAEMINSGIQPLQNLAVQRHVTEVLQKDGAAFSRHFVSIGLASLDRAAAETAGTFLVGDAVSLADVYLVPQLYAARRLDIDVAPFATLLRVEAACAALEAFEKARPEHQPDAAPPLDPPARPAG
jgi:maleylpyruvate isomerase